MFKKKFDQTAFFLSFKSPSSMEDASDGGRSYKTVLDRWRESLLSSTSLSQVFLHLSTLDRSVIWSKSILNARCKVCRKKGDAESMVLCDGCDRGYHTYCIRPKLKVSEEENCFLFTQKLSNSSYDLKAYY